jgi:HK97 family phage portal protein
VLREPVSRRLVYIVHPDPADAGGSVRVIDQDDMIHVPGFGFDGRIGYSPLRLALGDAGMLAKSTQDLSASFFKNGARPDFFLLTDANLNAEKTAELRNSWSSQHQGTGNGFKPAILTGGMKPHAISLPFEEVQMVATRQFQIEEIARIFGVPPFMIGHTEKTTSWGSGVEQMGIGFVKYTLQRHLSKIQTEFRRKCFRGTNRFAEFATAALERGDLKTQSEAFRIALGRAGEANWMTVNEVRRLLNMPPVEGGDAMRVGSEKPALTAEDLK